MSSTKMGARSAVEGEAISTRLVQQVASREGVDPIELDPVLYDVIDPDALDSLFTADDSDVSVEFAYHGYDVEVHADGGIDVVPRDD